MSVSETSHMWISGLRDEGMSCQSTLSGYKDAQESIAGLTLEVICVKAATNLRSKQKEQLNGWKIEIGT